MLCLLSPAKTLDFESAIQTPPATQPSLLSEAKLLAQRAKKLSSKELQDLMGVSDKIAELNVERFRAWKTPFHDQNSRPALAAFKGDVYEGLEAWTLSQEEWRFAQGQLRILSGLYGILRPLDLMQAYRLEMGRPLDNPRGKNLYEFWGDKITEAINEAEKEVLVNLASNEYFKSVQSKKLKAQVVTPQFKDWKNGQYKMISFYAKRARGLMMRFIIKNKIEDPDALLGFNAEGYTYNKDLSRKNNPTFTRIPN